MPSFSREQGPKKAKKPLVVFVCGDHEYSGENTLPLLAAVLEKQYGFRTKVLKSFPDQNAERDIPGLDILAEADLAVFFLRWRLLPADQVAHIEAYLKSGKPIMGFRTSTHSFNYPNTDPLVAYNGFAERAFGAPPGWGGPSQHTHYGHNASTDATVIAEKAKHPILTGVDPAFHVRSWLYRVLPDYPAKGTDWLLMGKAVNPDKPAVDQPIAWTWENQYKGKVFFTTMGHPEDFSVESFQRLVVNAVHWELGLKVPQTWAGKLAIHVPYRGMVNSK
ncbi:ThuA domain-containing protein [Aquirufa sp. A-Brett2-W8]